jgi:hypothetical protein
MATLDTNPTDPSFAAGQQRGRIYNRPAGGKNKMALIIGLILAAIAVAILLMVVF